MTRGLHACAPSVSVVLAETPNLLHLPPLHQGVQRNDATLMRTSMQSDQERESRDSLTITRHAPGPPRRSFDLEMSHPNQRNDETLIKMSTQSAQARESHDPMTSTPHVSGSRRRSFDLEMAHYEQNDETLTRTSMQSAQARRSHDSRTSTSLASESRHRCCDLEILRSQVLTAPCASKESEDSLEPF